MKVAIVIFSVILISCGLFCVLDNDNLFKSAPTYISKKADTLKLNDAMLMFKEGYYMGGQRGIRLEDLDEKFILDSAAFVNHFFKPVK
jgi:hypothetical protein